MDRVKLNSQINPKPNTAEPEEEVLEYIQKRADADRIQYFFNIKQTVADEFSNGNALGRSKNRLHLLVRFTNLFTISLMVSFSMVDATLHPPSQCRRRRTDQIKGG